VLHGNKFATRSVDFICLHAYGFWVHSLQFSAPVSARRRSGQTAMATSDDERGRRGRSVAEPADGLPAKKKRTHPPPAERRFDFVLLVVCSRYRLVLFWY
jgi:hypothetical protein